MTERLHIAFTPAEGALLRVLGTVERRGYAVRAIDMAERADGGAMTIELEPRDSSRQVEIVARQLDRLVDVRSVSILQQPQGSPR
ncbi:ACT domain-containing protein [Sphingomonas sp. ASV193]|uniref:ACT domain-containing protein n=1 Tax=Sphingomonas sp. ASV193 TaxID=3144405 RepID=UPI0032E90AB8